MSARKLPVNKFPKQGRATFRLPFTTVDVVIFSVLEDALCILLVRRPSGDAEPYPGKWALPGGFVNVDVDITLEACATRKLAEKTGVSTSYLEQLGSWGGADRDPRGWSATHVYFALIPAEHIQLERGANAADVSWFDVDKFVNETDLAFDHSSILATAVERLRSKVEYTSLPAFLVPEPFSLPQLQRVYEIVLGRSIDKSGFRTRMLAADFLVEDVYLDGTSNRPAMGYRLRDRSMPVLFPRNLGR
ncbi:NUDIX hydrolase [Pseudomonas bohemica]|uniref:NUDIX hydrolase n=1 Tax=Pseudomonas bohemica TaxID=2044872 RepID=UPI000DA61F6C|nr:NUDIX domain-containing protein [Pseudomonas bohemica]